MSAIDNKNLVVRVEKGVIYDIYICTDKYYKDNKDNNSEYNDEFYSNDWDIDVLVYDLTLLMKNVKGDDN